MAQTATINIPTTVWTQLTDADVTSITFQNRGAYPLLVKATDNATAPDNTEGAILYNPAQGERNVLMSDLFPGIDSPVRLWGYCFGQISVSVSHA